MKKLIVILSFVFICNPIIAEYYNSTISNGCVEDVLAPNTTTNRARLVAVFTPNEYTCNAGYFLPPNTDGCRPCPSGYTCSGGTFYASDRQAQGINYKNTTTTSITNGCSDNLLAAVNKHTKMIAIFEPNTVNLTWDDGTGNTVSTTCEYDGTITLPDIQPTRLGYTFTGWHVKSSN